MNIGISSVGLASAQGSVADILQSASLNKASNLPWESGPWTTCRLCRPARDIDASLSGKARWQRLARLALRDCLNGNSVVSGTPLIVASSNGAADKLEDTIWNNSFVTNGLFQDTPWEGQRLPMISGSCASGLQALCIASRLLESGHEQVFVLATDILSRANHENFEALRVLHSQPTPWQSTNAGFIPGEAAVALQLTKYSGNTALLSGPALGQEEGLSSTLGAVSTPTPELIIGQGSGPALTDNFELNEVKCHVNMQVPLTTPLLHFGHTNGASGLLSIALAALMHKTSTRLPVLSMEHPTASDGRSLANHAASRDTMVICRALSGACAAARVGGAALTTTANNPNGKNWATLSTRTPLINPILRQIAEKAAQHRPLQPPDLLLVRLERPILPLKTAQIGGRLLPSAILEITPGFIPQLIARCWGFLGAAICVVGDEDTETAANEMIQACRASGLMVCLVEIRGSGEKRHVHWNI